MKNAIFERWYWRLFDVAHASLTSCGTTVATKRFVKFESPQRPNFFCSCPQTERTAVVAFTGRNSGKLREVLNSAVRVFMFLCLQDSWAPDNFWEKAVSPMSFGHKVLVKISVLFDDSIWRSKHSCHGQKTSCTPPLKWGVERGRGPTTVAGLCNIVDRGWVQHHVVLWDPHNVVDGRGVGVGWSHNMDNFAWTFSFHLKHFTRLFQNVFDVHDDWSDCFVLVSTFQEQPTLGKTVSFLLQQSSKR